MLGGGFGHFSRQFGLLIDSLKDAVIVNYKGDILEASEAKNSNLFWAIRGAGAGQFGIVTSVRIQTYPIKEINLILVLEKPFIILSFQNSHCNFGFFLIL